MNKIVGVVFLLFVSIAFMHVQTGCANIIPPTGGPKDSLPPVLIESLPKDSSVNIKTNKILLTFDEYVLLDDNSSQDIIVSPNPESAPVITAKLKNVSIKLKDSLLPNTTYSINFGSSLKDVNEGNKFKNFTYVFSTGGELATGTLSGNVSLAETGAADSTLIVSLYTNLNDSAVKKLKPEYYTRIDSSGNFKFRYLPAAKFAIYVLPNDYTKRYDDSTKMFAFYNSAIDVTDKPDSIKLYAYREEKEKEKTAPPPSSDNKKEKTAEDKRLKLTTSLENNEQDLLSGFNLNFNRKIKTFDSAKVMLVDTNYKAITGYTWTADTSFKIYALQFKWPEDQPYKLIIEKEAFADSAGVTLSKADTISFKTKRENQYGSIKLHFNNINVSKNPVLQIIKGEAIAYSIPLTSATWYQKLFEPGEYLLRILYDDNKNTVWDPGNFAQKKQPEIVQRIARKLTIKPNWDNEVEINL